MYFIFRPVFLVHFTGFLDKLEEGQLVEALELLEVHGRVVTMREELIFGKYRTKTFYRFQYPPGESVGFRGLE